MATTVTTTESWGSRLGSSLKGVIGGLALFIAGFPLLFWNEGRTIQTRKALEEGQGACVSVESNATVDPANEGLLVHMTGKADTQETLTDAMFGVSEKAIRLVRTVEMYQWREDSRTSEKKKLGGSVETTTVYSYRQVWSENVLDSSSYQEAGHDNPAAKEFESETTEATAVTFGAYNLSPWQISSIGADVPYAFAQGYTCQVERVVLQGQTIYIPNAETRANPLNNRNVVSQPRIGDMRVTFRIVRPHDISLVAKVQGDTFVPYVAKNGKKVQLLSDGIKSSEEMFADAQSANTTLCWLLRLLGFAAMYIGVRMVLKPITVLADVLPILGDILEIGAGIVAFAVAAPCALVTIAVAWLYYRPVIGIALLVAAGAIIWWAAKKRKEKKAAAAAAAAEN